MDGFLLINKPSGPTSHDVVEELRTITGVSEIGHAGTLDPFAEGLLILLVGNFTKKAEKFLRMGKEYRATLRLGLESDTHDIEGEISAKREFVIPLREDIESALEKFRGEIRQAPPQFSAVKVKGKKAYEEARKGKTLKLELRLVTISRIETIWYKFPLLTLEIACSSGTYIRSLARDLGNSLGTGAICTQLRRLAIGLYKLEEASELKDINSRNWTKFLKYETNSQKVLN